MRFIALFALFLSATAFADEALVERDNVEIAPSAGVKVQTIEIDNRLGDVTVEGRDAPGITLSVVKHAPDEETLERLKVNLNPDPSGRVSISSALLVGMETRPIAAGQIRIDIRIQAPRGAAIQVKSWDGRVMVTGMHAGAELAAHDGDIEVRAVRGAVTTTNMRGNQRLTDVSGRVTADGTYGRMDLDTISGDSLAARVHRGTVVAQRVRSRSVRITTTFGDIEWHGELLAGANVELRSFRGNIMVQASGPFRVDAYTRDGHIEPQVELNQLEHAEMGRMMGTYGASENPAQLVLSSTAGRILFGVLAE